MIYKIQLFEEKMNFFEKKIQTLEERFSLEVKKIQTMEEMMSMDEDKTLQAVPKMNAIRGEMIIYMRIVFVIFLIHYVFRFE